MLIAIAALAVSVIAMVIIPTIAPPPRRPELRVTLENGSPPDPTFDTLRVILEHRGGDPLGIPDEAGDEFSVRGGQYHFVENPWENEVAWDSWVFSDEAGGLEFGENAVGILRHDDAALSIGSEVEIVIIDLRTGERIFLPTSLEVENSLR
jgi:hypothetical protein